MIRKIELQLPNRHDILLKKQMPAWDFRSSYGSLSSPAYRKACQRLEADIHILAGLVPNAKDSVSIAIALEHLAEVFLPDGFFNRLLPLPFGD